MAEGSPRVLHFNDCAGVGRAIVGAGARAGYRWAYLGPTAVRPPVTPGGLARVRWLPYVARRVAAVARAEVVHVHYATSVPLAFAPPAPRRPYVLHLHGTDIREQWEAPATRDLVRRAVEGAAHVYYTNLDTAEKARAARADAEFMPAFVEPGTVPPWSPAGDPESPRIVFASRWGPEKGARTMVEVAAALRAALPGARLVGLDWGPDADAARAAGVTLSAPLPHGDYVRLLASADVVVGQATGLLGVSELEAMATGAPLAMPGEPLRYPDGTRPPVLAGTPAELAEQVRAAVLDPGTAARLGGREWVLERFVADRYVDRLAGTYRSARASAPSRRTRA